MNTVTLYATSIKKIIKKIDNKLKEGFRPSVAFIYSSATFNIPKLSQQLGKYSFSIMGATTVGEIYANSIDGVNEVDGSIVCMLIEVDDSSIETTFIALEEHQDAYVVGEHIGMWSKSNFLEMFCLPTLPSWKEQFKVLGLIFLFLFWLFIVFRMFQDGYNWSAYGLIITPLCLWFVFSKKTK